MARKLFIRLAGEKLDYIELAGEDRAFGGGGRGRRCHYSGTGLCGWICLDWCAVCRIVGAGRSVAGNHSVAQSSWSLRP